jgi:hypothetical protein
MIPAAAAFLTGVLFLMSVGIEWCVMRCVQRRADRRALRRWAWKGNVMSYALILAFVLTFLYVPRAHLDRGERTRTVRDGRGVAHCNLAVAIRCGLIVPKPLARTRRHVPPPIMNGRDARSR